MKTLFTAFHNEEYLLPMWLTHHKKIFDHGILFDHRSTDRSVEIVNEICPTWEIRKIKEYWGDSEIHAKEISEVHKELDGWRMYLTPTEFLVGDIESLFNNQTHPQKIEIPTLTMFDWNPDGNLDLSIPFYRYTHLCKARSFHARPLFNFYEEFNGGFHSYNPNTDVAYILKYNNCISSPELLKRRLQFQNNYSPQCMQTQASWQHHNYGRGITREILEEYHLRHEYADISEIIQVYVDRWDRYIKSTVIRKYLENNVKKFN